MGMLVSTGSAPSGTPDRRSAGARTRRRVHSFVALAVLTPVLLGGTTPTAMATSADPGAPGLAPGTTGKGAMGRAVPALEPTTQFEPFEPGDVAGPWTRPRLSVSPAIGQLGDETMLALRIAYDPTPRLGWEAALGHNPGPADHGTLHNLGVIVRQPLAGRLQPYVRAGYGMFVVSSDPAIDDADPGTKGALLVGGGAEFRLRGDLALRAESQLVHLVGAGNDDAGSAAARYAMTTIGLAFHRTIGP